MDLTTLQWLANAIPNIGLIGLICWVMINAFIKDKQRALDITEESHKEALKDLRSDKEMLMELFMTQSALMSDMKNLLTRQTELLEKTERSLYTFQSSLDRMAEIQQMQAVKLESIEQTVEGLEGKMRKKGD